jgi:ATP-binding cassette subfamily B protein
MSLEESFAGDFVAKNAESQRVELKTARLSAKLGRTVDILTALSTAFVLWYGARLVIGDKLSPGDLIVFLTYLKRSFKPAKDFAKYTARLARAAASGERVIELLEERPDVADRPDSIVADGLTGRVRFENVSFEYEPGKPVLSNVDFDVKPGTFVAVTGHSGVGKSTLASLLLRLYETTEGRVVLDGIDVRDYTLASLRSQISVVLQDAIVFATTVTENIACGVPDASAERVEAAARLANAHEFITELPDGYDTVVGERGATLSRGQRQRIAVARAAMRKTPILILDEPTTGLDMKSGQSVMEALRNLASGRTTFLITHDLRTASSADVVIHLGEDTQLEHGSPNELMRLGGNFASLCKSQSNWKLIRGGQR